MCISHPFCLCPVCSKWQKMPLAHFGIRKELWFHFWLVFLVRWSTYAQTNLNSWKKKGEIINIFLLSSPPFTVHLKSRLINSYNSCFLPGECAARSDQNKETKKSPRGMHTTFKHSNNTNTDCPCTVPRQLCALCRAHSWWQNRNRSGTNWKPSALFSPWLYGYQE